MGERPEIGIFCPVAGSTSWKSRTRWTSGPTPVATVVHIERDADAHARALNRLRADAADGNNLMPAIIEAVRTYATLGEMCGLLRAVYGEYREPLAV